MMLAERSQTALCTPEIALAMPGLAPSYPPPALIADTRRVFVDQGLSLRGAFGGCAHLAIAGHVESDVALRILDILDEGSFKGSATVDEAYVAGRYEGVLKVAEMLVVGPSAHIFGAVECGRLQLEDGGRIEGELRVLADEAEEVPATDDEDTAFDALFIEAAPATEADADEDAAPIAAVPAAADSDGMLQSATEIEDASLLAEAEATFQAALKNNLCDLAALSGLGHLARQRGDLVGALHYFELIMAADAENVSVRCVSIDILRALARDDEATAMAKTVLSIRAHSSTPPDGEQAEDAAAPEFDEPGFDEAEAMFKSVLVRYPRNLGALAGLGHLARRRGDLAAMREYYLAALAVEPANLNLRVEVARAFKEHGDIGLAREILETVLTEQWGERDFARS
ncbi:MAG TPA: polymer-forming cytoskeletal protein [Stellaceae bacterium]|nr:polymer-forming cytoskeletal protein [Stellaceae bacterium]